MVVFEKLMLKSVRKQEVVLAGLGKVKNILILYLRFNPRKFATHLADAVVLVQLKKDFFRLCLWWIYAYIRVIFLKLYSQFQQDRTNNISVFPTVQDNSWLFFHENAANNIMS